MSLSIFYRICAFVVTIAVSTHLFVICHHFSAVLCRYILLLHLRFCLSLSQFQPIFLSFVIISAVLYRYILLLHLRFCLSLSQFQPIFLSFVTISAVLCRYPSRASYMAAITSSWWTTAVTTLSWNLCEIHWLAQSYELSKEILPGRNSRRMHN